MKFSKRVFNSFVRVLLFRLITWKCIQNQISNESMSGEYHISEMVAVGAHSEMFVFGSVLSGFNQILVSLIRTCIATILNQLNTWLFFSLVIANWFFFSMVAEVGSFKACEPQKRVCVKPCSASCDTKWEVCSSVWLQKVLVQLSNACSAH